MWWAGAEVCDLYLGLRTSGLACTRRAVAWAEHADAADGARRQIEALRRAGTRWRRRPLRLWLSSALARPFLMQPVQGLEPGELQALAQAQAKDSAGFDEACAVWVESSPAPRAPHVGVAMPAALRKELLAVARDSGAVLRSLRPWWAHALDAALHEAKAPVAAFTATDTDGLVLLAEREGRWALSESVTPAPAAEQADAIIARRLFACGIGTADVVGARQDLQTPPTAAPWPPAVLSHMTR